MVLAVIQGPWHDVLSETSRGVRVCVKVVPGSSRNRLAGLVGNRLKVTVTAPPEGGRANQAVCQMLGDVFGVTKRNIEVVEGNTRPQKTIEVYGIDLCTARNRLQATL